MEREFLIFENQKKIVKINIDDIIAITCEGTCSTVYYTDKLHKFTISKSLVQIERLLIERQCLLLRIHRNSIVSLDKIEMLDKKNNVITLRGGLELNVSIRQLPSINKAMKERKLMIL